MSFLSKLFDQANPFDNGKSFKNQNPQPKAPPARTPPLDFSKAKYGVLANNPQRQQQFQQSVAPRPQRSFLDRGRDIFDANTEEDKHFRFIQGRPIDYKQEQIQLNQEAQQANEKRSVIEQAVYNLIGGASDIAKSPGSLLDLKASIDNSTVGRALDLANPLKFGENIGEFGKDLVTGQPLGTTNQQTNDQIQRIGRGLNDRVEEGVQQSRFGQRDTDNKYVAGIPRAIGNVGSQVATSIATGGSTTVPSVLMGARTFSDQQKAAKEAGLNDDAALGVGLLQGGIEAALEKVSLGKLQNPFGGNFLAKTGSRFLTEGGQEGVQQFASNLITNKAYDPTQSLTEGVRDSALFGGIAGGVTGPAFDYVGKPKAQPTTTLVAPQQAPRPTTSLVDNDVTERLMLDYFKGRPEAINNSAVGENAQAPTSLSSEARSSLLASTRARAKFTPLNEGGYIQLPGGKQVNDPLYHGSPNADQIRKQGFGEVAAKEGTSRIYGDGTYLTNDRDRAALYGDKTRAIGPVPNNVVGVDVPNNARIYRPKDVTKELFSKDTNYGDPKLITEKYKKLGYDGIEISKSQRTKQSLENRGLDNARTEKNMLEREVILFDPKKVSVKKQSKPEPEYVYHQTNPDNLSSIQKSGLRPGMTPTSYQMSPTKKGVSFGTSIEDASSPSAGREGLLLRADKNSLGDYYTSKRGYEGLTSKVVDPKNLEASVDGGKTWKPITEPTLPDTIKASNKDTYYHGTTKADADSLVKNGFNPKASAKGKNVESPYALFASTDKGSKYGDHSAGTYGDTTVEIKPKGEVNLLDGQSKTWLDTMGQSKGAKDSAKWAKELKNRGYDGIKEASGEITILDPSKFQISKPKAPQVGKTPKFERDLNTGKMKMVSEPKTPVKTEKYSIANSDISRTRSPGMNEDGFTVEDWGGKKRYVSLEDASVETRTKVRKAEAEYEAAKKANNGTALSAKQKVNDAYSDAIDDLKLQDYATTENGGRTFNSKYNDWLETKYKDRNVDSATIKDMATNPQKYRSQFEAETTPVAQVGKTDINSKMLAEAKKRGYGDKYTQEGQIANTVDELMKEMNAVRDVGIPLLDKYKAKMDGKTSIEKLMTPAELKAYKQAQQTSDNASNLLKEYFDSKKSTPTPQVGKTDPLESLKQEADTGKVFYHGTSNKDLKSLADLQAGSKVGKSGRNRTYVTENPEIAKNFGENVIEERLYGKHLNVKDIGVERTPGWAQDNVVAPEFADYKTTKLLTEREKRVFENQFVKGVPNNTIIEDTPGIHKYLASKGYTTVTVPRTISDVDGVRSETIIIDKKAFQAPTQSQPPKTVAPVEGNGVPKTGVPYKATEYKGVGNSKREANFGDGNYTTPDKDIAKNYGKVAKVEVDLKNPYVITDPNESMKLYSDPKTFVADLKSRGYDGIIERIPDVTLGEQTITFKSAPVESSTPLSDATGEWLADYMGNPMFYGKRISPDSKMLSELAQFKPSKPVKLYRGVNPDAESSSDEGIANQEFSSWSKKKSVAQEFAGDGGKVESRVFNPQDIIVDTTRIPKNVLAEEFGNATDEAEVLVKNENFGARQAAYDKQQAAIKTPSPKAQQVAKQLEDAGLKPKPSKLTTKAFAETFNVSEAEAEKNLEKPTKFEAVKSTKEKGFSKLEQSMITDNKVTKAAIEAQQSGKEVNFFAKKDANDRSIGIEQFDPKYHKIEAGFVVDPNGNVLGNHIKVDETGIQINIGGELTNMSGIVGNPQDWGRASKLTKEFKGRYKISETISRNIDNNAPNKQVAQNTKDFLVGAKTKAEANYRVELQTEFKNLSNRIDAVNSVKPRGVSKTQYQDDIFSTLNGDKTDAQIKASYDKPAADAILTYKTETRSLYDRLLKRINSERVKFGQAPIDGRKDYITHLSELSASKSFTGEVYGAIKNSFTDDGLQKTRNAVPGDIAGRTENFKPLSAYNRFLQRRTGTKSLRDPFMAVQTYLEPALYNIHMTEPTVRARSVEAAFRTAETIRQMDQNGLLDETKKALSPYKNSGDNSKLVSGFQEYANALARKTQRFDRQLIDSSDAVGKGLKIWQGLQRVGGRATILGNLSSVLAQPLNQVGGIADAGVINYTKGIAATLGGDKSIEKSAFIRARRIKDNTPIRSAGQRVLDAGGVPLQKVETASIEVIWNSQHQKALSEGKTGQRAIQDADYNTERLVAGRGIADRPEVYRSTVANGILQYTLEVNAQNKVFWQDLNTGQKAKFMVASMGVNALMGAVTGYEPLPDFLKAAIQTGQDFFDDDEESVVQDTVQGIQRLLGEYASMNPLVSAGANTLPQSTRKTLFGSDSDVGRYPGDPPPVAVVKNVVSAGKNMAKGDTSKAVDDALRVIPFGNQIRKTKGGAQLLINGEDPEGNYQAPTSLAGKAQALAFGPNATKNAQNYYSQKSEGLTKDQQQQLRDAPPGKFDEFKQQLLDKNRASDKRKADKENKLKDSSSSTSQLDSINKQSQDRLDKLKASLSPDDYDIYNMTKAEQQEVINKGIKSADDIEGLKRYVENKKKELGFPQSTKTTKATDNKSIYERALKSFNEDKKSGKISYVNESSKKKLLDRYKVYAGYDKETTDAYKLSKSELEKLVTTNKNGKAIMEKMLEIDGKLVASGHKSKFYGKYGDFNFAGASAPKRKGYSAPVESQRSLAEKYFGKEANKALWVIQHESGGDPEILGDGGNAYGLFQNQHIARGQSAEAQFKAAKALYDSRKKKGGTGWEDWGENNLYNGKKFGALGNHPYPGDKAALAMAYQTFGGGGGSGGSSRSGRSGSRRKGKGITKGQYDLFKLASNGSNEGKLLRQLIKQAKVKARKV